MANKKDFSANFESAIDLFQQGRHQQAIELLEDVLQHWPQSAQSWFLLATLYLQTSRPMDAKISFQKATHYQNNYPDAYNNLGVVYEMLQEDDLAEKNYRKAIIQRPEYANAHYNLGQLLQRKTEFNSALEHYLLAVKYKPDYISALNNLAMVYQTKGHTELAKQYYRKALALTPNDPELLNNFGYTLYRNFEYSEALDYFNNALKLCANFCDAYLNIGLVLQAIGDFAGAENYFLLASRDPRLSLQAKNNLAHLELGQGNYQQGWRYYQFRPSARDAMNKQHTETLANVKSILLTKDQGVGDELFFLRFIPQLLQRDITVSYYCSKKLYSLLSKNMSYCNIHDALPGAHDHEIRVAIADLPRLIPTSVDTPPAIALRPEADRVAEINLHLPNNNRPNIAVTWQAGEQGDNKLFKRLPPTLLGEMLSHFDANIIILQRNPTAKDIKNLEKGLRRKAFNYSYINDSLDNTLALLSIVDQYIGVSNTNMHLMASLNKPAHVFVPHPPEWRWTNNKTFSPWFPLFKLYRQDMAGNWEPALHLCCTELKTSYK